MTNAAQPPKPWDHQVRALDFIRDKPGAMLAMDMGVGKDLDDRTPIPTPQGLTGVCKNEIIAMDRLRRPRIPAFAGMTEWAR